MIPLQKASTRENFRAPHFCQEPSNILEKDSTLRRGVTLRFRFSVSASRRGALARFRACGNLHALHALYIVQGLLSDVLHSMPSTLSVKRSA